MAYYYGNDPSSQYNQSDANGMQQRKLKQRRLGQAITGTSPVEPDIPEPPVDTPPPPTTERGSSRMIRSISDRGMGQPVSTGYGAGQRGRSLFGTGGDLFNRNAQDTGYVPPTDRAKRNLDVNGLGSGGATNPLVSAITGSTPPPTQTNPLEGVDRSAWNTEGWATPEYLGRAAGGAMSGWDQTNWDDPNMQTPKYVVGRILSNYTPSIEGLGQAMEEIQKAYPGATFDGKDKIVIPGLGTIDALVNAGGDNMSWAWQDLTNDPGTSGSLQQAVLGGAGDAMNQTQSILDGLDPALLQDPQWRELLKSLGVNI